MLSKKIRLRLGRVGDARRNVQVRYRAIHEIAFNDYSDKILNSWGRLHSEEELARREEKFNRRIKQEDNIIVVAEIDEYLAGFGEVTLSENELTALYCG